MSARDLRSEKVVNEINQHRYPGFVTLRLQNFDDGKGAFSTLSYVY